jgi:hypothetical protein
LARKWTRFFSLTVWTALKETVSPDFVLNLTLTGFATVLVATKRTFLDAMRPFYHRPMWKETATVIPVLLPAQVHASFHVEVKQRQDARLQFEAAATQAEAKKKSGHSPSTSLRVCDVAPTQKRQDAALKGRGATFKP